MWRQRDGVAIRQLDIFGDIFTAGKPVNITEPNAKNSPVFQNEPEEFLKCGPYLFIPMQQDGENIALVCISRAAGQEPFTQDEMNDACTIVEAASTALRPLNSFIAFTEHAELTKEGDIATKFQKALLPEKMPVINFQSENTLCRQKTYAATITILFRQEKNELHSLWVT